MTEAEIKLFGKRLNSTNRAGANEVFRWLLNTPDSCLIQKGGKFYNADESNISTYDKMPQNVKYYEATHDERRDIGEQFLARFVQYEEPCPTLSPIVTIDPWKVPQKTLVLLFRCIFGVVNKNAASLLFEIAMTLSSSYNYINNLRNCEHAYYKKRIGELEKEIARLKGQR